MTNNFEDYCKKDTELSLVAPLLTRIAELKALLSRWESAYSGYALICVPNDERYDLIKNPSMENIGQLVNQTRDTLNKGEMK